MAEKILNTRILLKYDSLENWNKSTGILRAGEVAIATYNIKADIDSNTNAANHKLTNPGTVPQVLVKVGDGNSTFAQLPYITAKAGDVYAWAKQAHPVYISGVNEETGAPIYEDLSKEILAILGDVANLKTFKDGNAQVIANAIKEAKDYTDAEIQKLNHVVDGSGNVVTNVTQANGIVTVTKGTLAVSDLEGGQGVLTDITNIETAIEKINDPTNGILATAEGKVTALANGAVATNTAAIEKINGTGEGSLTQVLADAKDYTDEQVGNAKTELRGYADQAEADALAEAKKYVDAEISAITGGETGSLSALEARVGVIEGDYLKEEHRAALAAATAKVAEDLGKEELRATNAETALSGRLDQVETFFHFASEEEKNEAYDTLKEIQDYIENDGKAAAQLTAKVNQNTAAIGFGEDDFENGAPKKTLVALIEEAENRVTEAVTNEETRAKSEEARIEGLANAAQGAAEAAQAAADAAQGEVDALELVVGAPAVEGGAAASGVFAEIAAEKARAEGEEGKLNTAITNETADREAAVKAINDKIGDGLEGEHTTLIAAINAANDGVSTNAGEISGIKEQLAGIIGTNGILGQANAYTDAEIVKVNNTITILDGEVVKTVEFANKSGKGEKVLDGKIENNKLTVEFDDTLTFILEAGDSTNLDTPTTT